MCKSAELFKFIQFCDKYHIELENYSNSKFKDLKKVLKKKRQLSKKFGKDRTKGCDRWTLSKDRHSCPLRCPFRQKESSSSAGSRCGFSKYIEIEKEEIEKEKNQPPGTWMHYYYGGTSMIEFDEFNILEVLKEFMEQYEKYRSIKTN